MEGLLLRRYWHQFVNRADTYCLQQDHGRYVRLRQPLTESTLAGHLAGAHTLALDAVGLDGLTRWLVWDSDTAEGIFLLAQVQHYCTQWELVTWLEQSRRGGHLWLLCATPQPAAALRRLAQAALDAVGITMEVYPNRDGPSHGAGVAQPVRLPLGVHQVSGARYPFVDALGRPLHRPGVDAALAWLLAQPTSHTTQIQRSLVRLGAADALAAPLPTLVPSIEPLQFAQHVPKRGGATWGIIGWVNHLPLPYLISLTAGDVALRRTSKAYLGWCPFHDDAAPQADGTPGTPSLYVWCDPLYGWHWRCLSGNCGALAGPAKDPFDWLVWVAGGQWRLALEWGLKLQEDSG